MLLFWWCPFKNQYKICQAPTWAVLIVWAYFRPLLEFARQYLLRLLSVSYKYSPRIERGEIYFYMYFLSLMAIKRTDTNAFLSEKLLWVVLTKKILKYLHPQLGIPPATHIVPVYPTGSSTWKFLFVYRSQNMTFARILGTVALMRPVS